MARVHLLLIFTVLALSALATAACGGGPGEPAGHLTVEPIASPAGAGSGEPALSAAGGRVWLSWIERRGADGGPAATDGGAATAEAGGETLLLSAWDGTAWSAPRVIASGVPLFVNWADAPSILAMADGTLVAHWLQKVGVDTYAYHVMLSWSADGGATWSPPVSPHEDRSATEHGFVSLVDLGPGRFGAAWLDGRRFAAGDAAAEETALMFAAYRDGASAGERLLDPRVCDCCQTAAAAGAAGVVVAYRDRSPDEIRDISRVVVPPGPPAAAAPPAGSAPAPSPASGSLATPAPVGADGWRIAGCPVNGPAIAADGDRAVVAWFTGERDGKRVLAAFSNDGGATFGDPIRIDLGDPAGRVDVEWLPDGRALVTWIEDGPGDRAGPGGADGPADAARIMGRPVAADGTAGSPLVLATTTSARASGFPRLARSGGDLLLAWTDPSDPPRVRLVRIAGPPRPGTGPERAAGPGSRS